MIGNIVRNVTVCFFLTFLLFSCSKKKEVIVIPIESQIASEAIRVLERINDAYLNKSNADIRKLTTPAMFEDFLDIIKDFEYAEITLTPKWIEIEDNSITIFMSWKGLWRSDNKFTNESGSVTFKLKSEPLILDHISGANPYLYPE